MPKALVFAPKFNTPGKSDATGAFQPEGHAFCKALSLEDRVLLFDNSATRPFAARRLDCERYLEAAEGVGIVAWLCHGWKSGIQAGWRTGDIHKLAASLFKACAPKPVILLYACDTGRDGDDAREDDVQTGPGGEGGFADMLRAECKRAGLQATIYAHSSEGHCTQNPHVRVFLPNELGGGRWVIDPASNLWPAWKTSLRSTDLRFNFAFLSKEQLHAQLAAFHV